MKNRYILITGSIMLLLQMVFAQSSIPGNKYEFKLKDGGTELTNSNMVSSNDDVASLHTPWKFEYYIMNKSDFPTAFQKSNMGTWTTQEIESIRKSFNYWNHSGARVQLIECNKNDWNTKYGGYVDIFNFWPYTIIKADGEVLDEAGNPLFSESASTLGLVWQGDGKYRSDVLIINNTAAFHAKMSWVFDPDNLWEATPEYDATNYSYSYTDIKYSFIVTCLHELGHTLGLEHDNHVYSVYEPVQVLSTSLKDMGLVEFNVYPSTNRRITNFKENIYYATYYTGPGAYSEDGPYYIGPDDGVWQLKLNAKTYTGWNPELNTKIWEWELRSGESASDSRKKTCMKRFKSIMTTADDQVNEGYMPPHNLNWGAYSAFGDPCLLTVGGCGDDFQNTTQYPAFADLNKLYTAFPTTEEIEGVKK